MSSRCIEYLIHGRAIHLIFRVIVLVLVAGCGKSEPATAPLPATATLKILEATIIPIPHTGIPESLEVTQTSAPLTATETVPTFTVMAPTATPMSTTPTLCAGLIPEIIKTEVRHHVDEGLNAGIVVGIVTPCGSETYAYGQTALSGGQSVDENTVFEIGSIGKTFTALLLADMVGRKEVLFDDPIEQFLPGNINVPKFNGRSITLMDLATHTSGLPAIPDNLAPADELNPYADYTVEQMYEALAQTRLTREIGSRYEYSNFGMGLLGHILSLQSGLSYEALVITRIANELGMPDTSVTLTPAMQSHLATGYRDKEPFPLWDIPTLAGAGALRSTVRDMLTFLAANIGLQESRLYEAMQLTHEPRYPTTSMRVGLAWHIRTQGALQIIEHHGATGGYWGFTGFVRDKQVGVVVLTNTFTDIDEIGLDLLRRAANLTSTPTSTPPLAILPLLMTSRVRFP
jgi:D-alanyl-D-alanine-carboxypeptidase/D-alanyl-D-alanine-endopeptidase